MTRLVPVLVLSACLAGHLSAQSLVIVSGNGQLVNSPSQQPNDLLVIQANDVNGNPVKGVAISWAITAGQGTIPAPTLVTDANGQASTNFTSTALNSGDSYAYTTVTASSPGYTSANFNVIIVAYLLEDGALANPPSFNLLAPGIGATLTASQGSTIPGAVQVNVQAAPGSLSNTSLKNVSLQLVDGLSLMPSANAHCNGLGGFVYSGSNGTAICDVVVTGPPGLYSLRAYAGQFHYTAAFDLQINPGTPCAFSISPTSNAVPATGGTGSVNVTAGASCGWTATSNASYITITSGASGTGNGTVAYSVAADAAGARTGTMTIAGKTFTVNEGSSSGSPLTITTPANLLGGTVNQSYSATLAASGGVPPYTWAITSGPLPAGLTLNPSTGLISGAPTTAGSTSFTATVQDSNAATASLVFSLTINPASTTFVITNTSFPDGIINQPYKPQTLTTSGGVTNGFNPGAFGVPGGALPPGLSIVRNPDLSSSIAGTPTSVGLFQFTLTATDSAGNTTSANLSITITGTPTGETMGVSPGTLSFTAPLGSPTPPATQSLSITGNGGPLAYTSVATTASGGSWLVLQNSASNTPGTINVSVTNYANLQPGPYTGTVTISSAAANNPVAVPVTLTVAAAPQLNVSPQQINLSQGQSTGSNVTTQSIQVSAGSPGAEAAVGFSATATTNKGGNWLSVSPTAATTPATLMVSIDSGGLPVGFYPGVITIEPTAGAVQLVTVSLNVINPQTLSATPSPVAFTYTPGAPAPEAQSVTVSSSTGPALSLSTTVTTSDNGNWLFVNPGSGTTPLALSVSVNPSGLATNTYSGTITVTASDDSVTPLAIPVKLTVTPAGPVIASVVNAASSAPGPVAPGEFVTIYGSGLGPATGVASTSSGTIGTSLGETLVFFDSVFTPILYSSAGQVNVIVPFELATKSSTNLTVWYKGTASAGDDLRVVDSAPGIFVLNAAGQGAIVNQDGTINSTTNGAAIGSIVSIYATGQGVTNPPGVDGAIATAASPQPPPLPVTVQIGGLPATVQYAGAAPGEPDGFMQVNATVPAGVPAGKSVPVVVTVGTASSQAGVTIAIHP
jgi:uncharacterized protein (TIGR03437 family)